MSDNEAIQSTEKKILSVQDYLKSRDGIVDVELSDCILPIRIKKPSPRDAQTVLEYLQKEMGNKTEEMKIETASDEERVKMIKTFYMFDALQVSSCCFHPDMNTDPPVKIWPTADDALDNNTTELFEKLKGIVASRKFIMTEGEAKK